MLMLADHTQTRRLVWIGVVGPRLEMFADGLLRFAFRRTTDQPGEVGITRLVDLIDRHADLREHGTEGATDMDGAAVGIYCHTTSYAGCD